MKINVKELSYDEVMALPKREHKAPTHQKAFFRWLLRTLSQGELKQTGFTVNKIGMEKLAAGEPALFLMNHSSFTDLQIAAELLHDREFHIICTVDGFVGKEGLMRAIGCIPTQKFVMDATLVKDMKHTVDKLKSSILMYPEASYSFDGTETPLPESLGKFLKFLKVPVVMIKTEGAFLRDPLYNLLQKRQVKVSADMTYLLSPADIKEKSVEELNEILKEAFTYDHFRTQFEHGVKVTEPFRADGLERALYHCPVCGTEGKMRGKGISITCECCGASWELEESGKLKAAEGKKKAADSGLASADHESVDRDSECAEYKFVSDWYREERALVKRELEDGTYRMECDVDIVILKDLKSVYRVGEGHLTHTADGFVLDGCDGKLHYEHGPMASYSLYADYFWYELGDVIAIGTSDITYYCFPKGENVPPVAKARLAAEELYKLKRTEEA